MAKIEVLCAQCGTVEIPTGKPQGSGPVEAVLWIGSALLFAFTVWTAMMAMGLRGDIGDSHAMGNSDARFVGMLFVGSIAGFVVSIIYSIARRINQTPTCRRCASQSVIPTNTPVAKQKLQEIEAARLKAKYSEEVAAYRQQIRSEIGRAPAQ